MSEVLILIVPLEKKEKEAIQHRELPKWSPTPVLNRPIKLNFAIRNGMRCELDGMAVSYGEKIDKNKKEYDGLVKKLKIQVIGTL